MLPATPRKTRGEPRAGSVYLTEVLGENIKRYRGFLNLSQHDLSERMIALGHKWHSQTVGEVERGNRLVNVEELVGLALALTTSAVNLLVPVEVSGNYPPVYDLGGPTPVKTTLFRRLLESTGDKIPYAQVLVWKGNEPIGLATEPDIVELSRLWKKTGIAFPENAESESASSPKGDVES